MEAAEDLQAAITAAAAVRARFRTASDRELVADLDAVETLGRLVDALRIGVAAEVEARSPQTPRTSGLAFGFGTRSGIELIEQIARVSHREATRRVGLGAALAPRSSLAGEPLPGDRPELADAVTGGVVGVEAARVILDAAHAIRRRVPRDDVDTMVEALTETAATASVEELKVHAEVWALRLDPDGSAPKEQAAWRSRALRLGPVRADGTARLTATLTTEHAALVKEILDRRGIATPLVRTAAGGDARSSSIDPEWVDAGGDSPDAHDAADPEVDSPVPDARTRSQRDYDALFDVITVGATTDGASPTGSIHEVVVTTTVEDVEGRSGAAFASGMLAGLAAPVVERMACGGRIRLLVTGPDGEPLHLGRAKRLFSAAQRRAILTAAGGACQIPGCRVTDPYLQVHHVEWWTRDGGPTDVENGIAVCSFHHHLLHAEDGPLELVRHDGSLHAVPRTRWGPPDPRHRVRTGPRAQTGIGPRPRLRRTADDPWHRAPRSA